MAVMRSKGYGNRSEARPVDYMPTFYQCKLTVSKDYKNSTVECNFMWGDDIPKGVLM